MRSLIKIFKATLLALLNLIFICIGLVIAALPAAKIRLRAGAAAMMAWAKWASAILGIRVRKTGPHPCPKGSFIVANHCSYLDILVLGSLVPGVFVAKQEVAEWPILGRLSRLAGTVFVDRSSRISALTTFPVIESHLASDISVILFPEGTTNNGTDILAFKSSFFKIPIETGRPVQPVSLIYTHINGKPVRDGMRDEVAWYGTMSLLPHLWRILGMRSIDAAVRFNPVIHGITAQTSAETRKKVSSLAYESIRAGYESLQTD